MCTCKGTEGSNPSLSAEPSRSEGLREGGSLECFDTSPRGPRLSRRIPPSPLRRRLMKAIVLTEYGGTDKLQFREHPEPQVGAGQIKVRVASASINPIDWKMRSGTAKA